MSKTSFYKVLGNNLVYHRKRAFLTQQQLSSLTKVHRTYISEIERGIGNPCLFTLIKLAKALDIHVRDLTRGF